MLRFVTAVVLSLVTVHAALGAGRPNVIFVMTDDQGFGDVAADGNTMIKTPNMDKLHDSCVRLNDYHVDPTCSPTRSALMTGRYSSRTGVWHTIMGRSIMRSDELTVAEAFKSAGYRTGIFGKWHLGDAYPARPQDQGFDRVVIHGGGGVTQTPDYWGNSYFNDTYWVDDKPTKFTGYCTDVFFDEALKFIHDNKDKPFFCYLPTNAPHGPYNVAEKYSKPYVDKGVPQPMANFYGMITNIDENLGVMLAKLKEWGLEDNTIFVFTTDNGSAAGAPGSGGEGRGKAKGKAKGAKPQAAGEWVGFNAGMRGAKGSQYEGGHRVPFFIRWPAGHIGGAPGRDVNEMTAHIDVMPTLLDLCGITKPDGPPLDGVSIAPLLRGEGNWKPRTLFAHSQRIEDPLKWKTSSVMTQQYRLIDGKELYDITADPGQAHDIAADHKDVVDQLRGEYEKWWASISTRFGEYVPYVLGSDAEQVAKITAMDWHAPQEQIPWNHEMIKKDPEANGFWVIEIAKAGRYEFMLRRRPQESGEPVNAKTAKLRLEPMDSSEKPIEQTREVMPPETPGVSITVTLQPGKYKLQTFLAGNDGKTRGAFYVYARWAGAAN